MGVVLAGGLSRRMGGGDKCLLPLGSRTLLDHVVERARPQVSRLVLNANGDPRRLARFGLTVVSDGIAGHPGPLAGVLAGMEWTSRHVPECRWIVTFPGDAPFVPRDLASRLLDAAQASGADIAVAEHGGRRQQLAALWPVSAAAALRTAITTEGAARVEAWQARFHVRTVAFEAGADPFLNINEPADLEWAGRLLEAGDG